MLQKQSLPQVPAAARFLRRFRWWRFFICSYCSSCVARLWNLFFKSAYVIWDFKNTVLFSGRCQVSSVLCCIDNTAAQNLAMS